MKAVTDMPDRKSYASARVAAAEALRALDPRVQAERCGGEHAQEGGGGRARIRIAFMGGVVDVLWPECEAFGPDGGRIDVYDEILVLRYLGSTAALPSGAAEAAEPISFAEMPAGEFYMPAFRRRAIALVVATFGERPDLLAQAASAIGGRPAGGGDAGVIVPAFPRIDVTVLVWRGEEDLPPDASMLMSGSVASYLSTEDVAVLCGAVATRLARAARAAAGAKGGKG